MAGQAPPAATASPPRPGRYHLYVSLACPWAHRTLIMRALKGLEQIIPVSVTHWLMAEQGWTFSPGEGVIPDPLFNSRYLHEIYTRADAHYTGRASVPGAVGPAHADDRQQRIVRNHPHVQQRLRCGGRAAGRLLSEGAARGDRRAERAYLRDASTTASTRPASPPPRPPTRRRSRRCSRRWTGWRSGWRSRASCATTRFTEADIRLFTTLVRFDPVYHGHFKCNIRRLIDYRNLWAYTRDIYQMPGVAATVNLDAHQAALLPEPQADQSDRHRAGSDRARL